jgi:hypothetical protein
MTKLTGEIFEKLYLDLFEILGKSSERPSKTKLTNLYKGVGGVPGFYSYSQETFARLCGLAQRECQWMPAPAWFEQRRQELSIPGQEAVKGQKALPETYKAPDPGVVTRMLAKAIEEQRATVASQTERASKLVAWTEKKWVIDPGFQDWVLSNLSSLADRYQTYRKRAKGNRDLLVHLLACCATVQLQYIQHLDNPADELDNYLKELSSRRNAITR